MFSVEFFILTAKTVAFDAIHPLLPIHDMTTTISSQAEQSLSNLAATQGAAVLTLSCVDKLGIVGSVSSALAATGCNIIEAAQFSDSQTGIFFMRIAFSHPDEAAMGAFKARMGQISDDFRMTWALYPCGARVPTLLMASKLGHCLHDLLLRWQTGILPVDIKAIVSNHEDFRPLAASHNIPFHHIPVTPQTKPQAEAALMRLVRQEGIELVVLARYMQILSDDLCQQLEGRAINIHHSFLPGFKGAKPYHQAHARGVKLIGATAHYVTGDLDEGPIIEQGVERASHALSPEALTMIGRDIESLTLARAVKWHCERRVLLNGMKTVVFN